MNIKQVPAHVNNYGVGRVGNKVEYIVMHWIVGTLESADTTFQNPTRKASAHYGIGDSDIHQYVKEEDTAWHASNLVINRKSIGIEHEGGWEEPKGSGKRVKPSQQTHETSAQLIATLAKKYNIPLDREHIIKHNEVSGASTACCGTLDVDLIIKLAKAILTPPTSDCSELQAKFNELEEKYTFERKRWAERDVEWDKKNDQIKALQDTMEIVRQNSFTEGVRKGRDSEFDRITKQLGILEIPEPKEDFDFAKWKSQQLGTTQSSFIAKLISWLTSQKE